MNLLCFFALLLAAPLALAADPAPKPEPEPQPPPMIALESLPQDAVRVEIFENITAGKADAEQEASWAKLPSVKTDEFHEPAFALAEITNKYNARGVKVDRSRPALLRAAGVITLPPGEHRLLLRALTDARLALDGETIARTPFRKRSSGDDNEPVPDQAALQLVPGLRLLPPGHREALVTVRGDGQPHVLTLEAFFGGKIIRPDLGELSVSVASESGPWRLLTTNGSGVIPDEGGWKAFASEQRARIARANAERRRNADEEKYWQKRHDLARQHAASAPEPPAGAHAIDGFLAARIAQAGATPAPRTDDAAFLRRVTLDTIGLVPTSTEAAAFLADPAPDKRTRTIDRLLADPRWADRWVPYWQDVLAENPNILKGTLNNTGPFRWWLHEALLDNKPLDRFVTELIAMEGSAQYGGPAGFGIASQNDLPMAAKAQIISSAFLAMEMKCARCHDAPNHPFDQEDLFSLASMLQRKPLKVPGSSLTQGLSENSHVVVSLKAGQVIDPHWPLADLSAEPLTGVLRRPDDSRERLVAILTDPRNPRFAQVAVNRLWKELIGFGIVEPVDDWESSAPANAPLLAWLGRELSTHDYDLKHVARLILNSETYQRVPTAEGSRVVTSSERLFAAPARRRLHAEQLVDSLFAIAGKDFGSEMLTQDPECRQVANDHGNFGVPGRAWEFVGLSNERDRPALAKPRAAVVTDVLTAFGWRENRPEPRSTREADANVLQPALLANGTLGSRIVRLSEDSALTALALEEQPLERFIAQLFLRVLARPPAASEAARFTALLEPGFAARRTGATPASPRPPSTRPVSWANHLNPEATNVVLAIEREVQAGDPPTTRLQTDWRERLEDTLWALLLSPEFVYLP